MKWFFPIMFTAMALAFISEQVALVLGFEPPPQDLVKLFTDPNVAWHIKAKFAAVAVLLAPVLEEIIFRMGLFRFFVWLGKRIRKEKAKASGRKATFPPVASLMSGAVFAAVHLHAATFLPLWFLGVAFAWLYWRSGTLLSPIFCHFMFNLMNLILCLIIGNKIV